MSDEAETMPEVDRSLDGAVDRAFDKAFAEPAAEPDEPVADDVVAEEAPSGPARGPDGKFVAKEAAEPVQDAELEVDATEVVAPVAEPAKAPAAGEAPARFSAEAKAAWSTTPPQVQAEIGRAFSELERGINEYRAKYEPIRAIAEQAEAQGQTLSDVIENYKGIEDELRANPLQGLDRICQNLGLTLRDVAAHVMGQPAPERDEQVQHLTSQMREMQGKLAHYEAQERRQQQEVAARTLETVSAFASDHPRVEELHHQIRWALRTEAVPRTGDVAKDLQNAYEFAARLIPDPVSAATAATPAPEAKNPPLAHPKKAGISIDGAPGSNPLQRTKSKNVDEAIDRAFDQIGL